MGIPYSVLIVLVLLGIVLFIAICEYLLKWSDWLNE